MDNDDTDSTWGDLPDAKRQHAITLKQQIGALITQYVDTIRTDTDEWVTPDDRPFVQAWIIGVEWTNIRLEQADRGGRDIIAPEGQTLSNGAGLGNYIAARYT